VRLRTGVPDKTRKIFILDGEEWVSGWYHSGNYFTGSKELNDVKGFIYHDEILDDDTDQLVSKVEAWHHARNLVEGSDAKTQFAKLISEAGELADNIAKGLPVDDDIGDMAVVLILIALQKGTTFQDCLAVAYDDIKDRTGKMINGTFVKDVI
jgi:hypothetical protein